MLVSWIVQKIAVFLASKPQAYELSARSYLWMGMAMALLG